MPKIAVIYTTCKDKASAKKIAKTLIKEKIIACANILGESSSLYLWNGKLAEETEVIMILKTKKSLEKKAMERIKELHDYKCPCIISLEVSAVNSEYLKWAKNTCISSPKSLISRGF